MKKKIYIEDRFTINADEFIIPYDSIGYFFMRHLKFTLVCNYGAFKRLYGWCSYNNFICIISDLQFSYFMIGDAVLKRKACATCN